MKWHTFPSVFEKKVKSVIVDCLTLTICSTVSFKHIIYHLPCSTTSTCTEDAPAWIKFAEFVEFSDEKIHTALHLKICTVIMEQICERSIHLMRLELHDFCTYFNRCTSIHTNRVIMSYSIHISLINLASINIGMPCIFPLRVSQSLIDHIKVHFVTSCSRWSRILTVAIDGNHQRFH